MRSAQPTGQPETTNTSIPEPNHTHTTDDPDIGATHSPEHTGFSASHGLKTTVDFSLNDIKGNESFKYGDGRSRKHNGQYGKTPYDKIQTLSGVSVRYGAAIHTGDYQLGALSLKVSSKGFSGSLKICGDAIQTIEVNKSLQELLTSGKKVGPEFSREIIKNVEDCLRYTGIDTREITLDSISLLTPGLEIGFDKSPTGASGKIKAQYAAIDFKFTTPIGEVNARLVGGISYGKGKTVVTSKNNKVGVQERETFGMGIIEVTMSTDALIKKAKQSFVNSAFAQTHCPPESTPGATAGKNPGPGTAAGKNPSAAAAGPSQSEQKQKKSAQKSEQATSTPDQQSNPKSKPSEHTDPIYQAYDDADAFTRTDVGSASTTSPDIPNEEAENRLFDALVGQLAKSALRFSPRDSTIPTILDEYEREKSASSHSEAYMQFQVKLNGHLERERGLDAVMMCGSQGAYFLSQVAQLTGNVHIANFAQGLSGVTQTFAGLRTFSNEIQNLSRLSSLGSGIGALECAAGVFSGLGMVIGGLCAIGSLFGKKKSNKAMKQLYSAIMDMWKEMRSSFEITWEHLKVIDSRLCAVDEKMDALMESVAISSYYVLGEIRAVRYEQNYFHNETQRYLKHIVNENICKTLQILQLSEPDERIKVENFNKFAVDIAFWLMKTSKLESGKIETTGDYAVSKEIITQKLKTFFKAKPEVHVSGSYINYDVPLGLFSQLAQPDVTSDPNNMINPQGWKNILDCYIALIHEGGEVIASRSPETHDGYIQEIDNCFLQTDRTLSFYSGVAHSATLWARLVSNYQKGFDDLKSLIERHMYIGTEDERYRLNALESLEENFVRLRRQDGYEQTRVNYISKISWLDQEKMLTEDHITGRPRYSRNWQDCRARRNVSKIFELVTSDGNFQNAVSGLLNRDDFYWLSRFGIINSFYRCDGVHYFNDFHLRIGTQSHDGLFPLITFLLKPSNYLVKGPSEKTVKFHSSEFQNYSVRFLGSVQNLLKQRVFDVHRANMFAIVKADRTWNPIIENIEAAYLELISFIKLIHPDFKAPETSQAIQRLRAADNILSLYDATRLGATRGVRTEHGNDIRSEIWQEELWPLMSTERFTFDSAALQKTLGSYLSTNPIVREMSKAKNNIRDLRTQLTEMIDEFGETAINNRIANQKLVLAQTQKKLSPVYDSVMDALSLQEKLPPKESRLPTADLKKGLADTYRRSKGFFGTAGIPFARSIHDDMETGTSANAEPEAQTSEKEVNAYLAKTFDSMMMSSSVEGGQSEESIKTIKLLKDMSNVLHEHLGKNTGHIFIGVSSAGKSFVLNALLGVKYEFILRRKPNLSYYKPVTTSDEFSPSSEKSDSATTYPIIKKLPDARQGNEYIIDTAGLNDTRGISHEIARGMGMIGLSRCFSTISTLNVFFREFDLFDSRLIHVRSTLEALSNIISQNEGLIKNCRIIMNRHDKNDPLTDEDIREK